MRPHLPLRTAGHTNSYPSGYEKLSVHAARMNTDFRAPCTYYLWKPEQSVWMAQPSLIKWGQPRHCLKGVLWRLSETGVKIINNTVAWHLGALQCVFNRFLKTSSVALAHLLPLINYSNFNLGKRSTFIATINSTFKLFKKIIQWDRTYFWNTRRGQEWFQGFTVIKREVQHPIQSLGGVGNLSTQLRLAHW